jgi:16S rRNA C967 or C1407 C5-methylase (RsmB/RsmF family)/NOL1/NOP2/fmu family ribosome biogenesis protein
VQLPVQLLDSLRNVPGFDKEAFEKVHVAAEEITSVRINPVKRSAIANVKSQIPWTEFGYYLRERPSFTFDPLFHAGCYYVQEASSMFLEQAFKHLIDLSRPLKVLDLSAAPGGKSTHIQSLISPDSLLVSNDVIRSRAVILKDNIIKWGCENVMVTNNDPKDFEALEDYFDIIVVDAPCSGSGLFRREPDAIEEWSLNHVQLCSQRQQRIVANVWKALKKDGLLIYSTCSYSTEEDDAIVEWMIKQLPAVYCPLSIEPGWGITETSAGYRFWPHKLKGEGFFLSCLRKSGDDNPSQTKSQRSPAFASKKEIDIVDRWAVLAGRKLVKSQERVYAWPEHLSKEFNFLLNQLRVMYSGTILGAILREKFVPDHALAMSSIMNSSINRIELTYEEAIAYLKRKDLSFEKMQKGWQLVTFENHTLGWINALSNRINNYYPKELRILKD